MRLGLFSIDDGEKKNFFFLVKFILILVGIHWKLLFNAACATEATLGHIS